MKIIYKKIVAVSIFVLLINFIPQFVFANGTFLQTINNLLKNPSLENNQVKLSEEELAGLSKASIVKVVQHVEGKISFELDFILDFKTMSIKPAVKSNSYKTTFDYYLDGTGFIISKNGYIITNSHVVSPQIVINKSAIELSKSGFDHFWTLLSKEDKKVVNDISNTPEGAKKITKLGADFLQKIIDSGKIEGTSTVTVLNPASKKTSISDLIKDGFLAKVINVDNNYYKDQKDLAVIKIEQDDLPTLPLFNTDFSSTTVSVGSPVFVSGFPSNADINSSVINNILQSTFTSGKVAAFKDSMNGDFKIIETDTKISEGSSGSPVLNSSGQVFGIMTYVTGDNKAMGDSFSKDDIKNLVTKEGNGKLYENFIDGLRYLNNNHCDKAIESFRSAKDLNPNFSADVFIDVYIDKCLEIKAAGKSIDNDRQQFLENIKPWKAVIIISVSGFLIVVFLIITLVFLSRKLKKDEKVMKEEEEMNSYRSRAMAMEMQSMIAKQDPSLSVPNSNIDLKRERMTNLLTKVDSQRIAGVETDALIVELRSQGYSDAEIQEAFNKLNGRD
jgi:Trypsin-like peptidase domain